MLPQSFTERMQGLLESEYEEFLASFEHEKYRALRLNPLKRDDMSVITEKVKQTFQLQPVPWAENGYYYTKEDQPGKHFYRTEQPESQFCAGIWIWRLFWIHA